MRSLALPGGTRAHPWARRSAPNPSVFLDSVLANDLTAAAKAGGRRKKEILGLLLGDVLTAPHTGAPYTVVLAGVTAPVESSASHVRFDREKFDAIAAALERQTFDYLMVGWYHSHVNIGCFMSAIDQRTQEHYFRLAHQHAFVIDGDREEVAAFAGAGAKEVPFAVFDNATAGNPDYRLRRRS